MDALLFAQPRPGIFIPAYCFCKIHDRGHEYEWGHKGGHPPRPFGLTLLAGQYATHRADGMVANNTFFVMSWGESVSCEAASGTCG